MNSSKHLSNISPSLRYPLQNCHLLVSPGAYIQPPSVSHWFVVDPTLSLSSSVSISWKFRQNKPPNPSIHHSVPARSLHPTVIVTDQLMRPFELDQCLCGESSFQLPVSIGPSSFQNTLCAKQTTRHCENPAHPPRPQPMSSYCYWLILIVTLPKVLETLGR